jgi:2'-5' RNA ligase
MQLHAALVPPADVVHDALDAAREMLAREMPTPPPAADDSRRGILGRVRGRRRADAPDASDAPAVTLEAAPPEAVFMRLAKFGNVVATDVTLLARALEELARTWPDPLLHVSAVRVADATPFDVTAQLDGEVDALRDIFRNVHEAAQSQRFFLDRRSYRNELVLGSVGVQDDAPVPDAVAGAEAPHVGPRWSPSHITLLRTSFVDGGTTFVEVARIPLADSAAGLDALSGA